MNEYRFAFVKKKKKEFLQELTHMS